MKNFIVQLANNSHLHYANTICNEMEASAKARGTGIAKRSPEYLEQKMLDGKAIIAFSPDKQWAGFCYIETWSHGNYVANSGLIVAPEFRKSGLAKAIKEKVFELSKTKYPNAKIFGLTTGLAVMKINSDLGYEPVTYSELTQDEDFWKGCRSCVNFEILKSKDRKNCLCTAMLYNPDEKKDSDKENKFLNFKKYAKLFERITKIKKTIFLKQPKVKNKENEKISSISI
ncbi:GNAT family N-acetyltransferase [Sediminibacterium sp.]|uniref:GNAT family N-acetyltransferase n=1 Tax=Sediminibacterium sp. TaxID=1917865 RepID=UPI002736D8FC|nr:GNAT family N-acetyltransferase [Sediminibacterium sp.]MDP3567378.1 GNAT family N-acetyltransferase [Sediminibacterium sp.]